MTVEMAEPSTFVSKKQPMGFIIDRYLRRRDSGPAKLLSLLSPAEGENYLRGSWKRSLDLLISIPAAVAATPVIALLALAKTIEDGAPPFFVQQRTNGQDQTITIGVIKIRSMRPHSDFGIDNLTLARGMRAREDSRNTRLGSFMRRFQLDELPQLFQVACGQLSLIGIRITSPYVFDYLQKEWPEERYERWKTYYLQGRTGLSGLNQIFGSGLKENEKRYHLDAFYAKHASLGLDCYLIYKTLIKIFRS